MAIPVLSQFIQEIEATFGINYDQTDFVNFLDQFKKVKFVESINTGKRQRKKYKEHMKFTDVARGLTDSVETFKMA